MKKLVLLILFLFLIQRGYSLEAGLFEIDKQHIESELGALTQLENQVLAQSIISGVELQNENSISNLSLDLEGNGMAIARNTPDNSAFFLGCCLGPIGLAIVLANKDNNHDAVSQAFFGCVVPTSLFSLGIFLDDPFFVELAIEIFIDVFQQ